MIELVILGMFVGTLSGFFGIGGGTILIPLLLFFGYEIKSAIGISVVQMTFSSIFGSYLNLKKGSLDLKIVSFIGAGGFLGALLSGFFTQYFSHLTLEIIFLFFATFALLRLFFHTHQSNSSKEVSSFVLFIIGIPIGAISMMIGVGGSIILVPLLVGFLHIELKRAISAGLFFVIFSSVAGFISHLYYASIDFYSGMIIGLASLVGVFFGIYLKEQVSNVLQRKLLILFYLMIVLYLAQRIIGV